MYVSMRDYNKEYFSPFPECQQRRCVRVMLIFLLSHEYKENICRIFFLAISLSCVHIISFFWRHICPRISLNTVVKEAQLSKSASCYQKAVTVRCLITLLYTYTHFHSTKGEHFLYPKKIGKLWYKV